MCALKQATRKDAVLLAGVTAAGLLVILWGACFLIVPVWQPGYSTAPPQQTATPRREPVNPNTADLETLMTLPGIGEEKAAAILAYRDEHGPFLFAEELADVPGISMQMVEQWADLITLDPEF